MCSLQRNGFEHDNETDVEVGLVALVGAGSSAKAAKATLVDRGSFGHPPPLQAVEPDIVLSCRPLET